MDLITLKLDDLLIAHKDLVLLTSVDVRRFIKKMIEGRFPDLEVLSFGEIADSKSVNVIKQYKGLIKEKIYATFGYR